MATLDRVLYVRVDQDLLALLDAEVSKQSLDRPGISRADLVREILVREMRRRRDEQESSRRSR